MALKVISIQKAFMFFEPGPVLLVTTKAGRKNNVMTLSWHMVIDFTPRLAITTGPWNYSFANLLAKKECVLCVPTLDLAETVVSIGSVSGAEVDKFKKFGLTAKKAKTVHAPLIEECLFCLECKLVEYIEEHGIIILEGTKAWYDADKKEKRTFHANGDGTFVVDGSILNYRSIMKDKIPPGV